MTNALFTKLPNPYNVSIEHLNSNILFDVTDIKYQRGYLDFNLSYRSLDFIVPIIGHIDFTLEHKHKTYDTIERDFNIKSTGNIIPWSVVYKNLINTEPPLTQATFKFAFYMEIFSKKYLAKVDINQLITEG